MGSPGVFLTARWKNLALCTYKVDPKVLQPYMPSGLEADTINGDAFVSLVAFDFLDTKVKGIKFPFHVNFPEINLRFYVKNNERRGVVFIKEFVPRTMIAFFARVIYNERYKSIPMKSEVTSGDVIDLTHTIKRNGREYTLHLKADNKPFMPPQSSTEHFFKEHEWGFGSTRGGIPLVYRVEHPFWNVFPVKEFRNNFDFGRVYGDNWSFLNDQEPYNITFAEGSKVKVFGSKRL
jgi:uncharacterized protein YqjF (DUF2071 family)